MEKQRDHPDGTGSGFGLAALRAGRAPSRGKTSEAVTDALRQGILDGTLRPGTWLREVEVARELEVSRTPVRDAFRILAAEELVSMNANQGAVVAAMTSDDVLDLYAVRQALEAVAARLAARRAAQRCFLAFAALIPKMRAAGEEGRQDDLFRMNFEFHTIIREASGNRYLERSLAGLQNASRRLPNPTLRLPGRVAESIQEHVELADAISQGDEHRAERLALEHMRRLAELRIQVLLRS